MLKIQKLEWLMLLLQQYTLTIKCTRFLSRFSCMFCSFFYSHQCSKNNLSFIRSRKKKVQFRKIMDHLVLVLFMYFLKIRVLKLSSACAWFLKIISKKIRAFFHLVNIMWQEWINFGYIMYSVYSQLVIPKISFQI